MGTLGQISGGEDVNLSLMKRIFQQVMNGMEAKENELKAMQESLVFRLQHAEKGEREIKMLLENGLEKMEMLEKKLGLMLEDVVVRQEKVNEQERKILGLFDKIEVEGRELQVMKKILDEEIGASVRLLEESKKKARDVDEKEEKLERFAMEINLKERVLGLKEKGLLTKEKELEAKEELRKFRKKHNENDPRISPQPEASRDMDLAKQSKYAGKRKKSRAREEENPSSFTNCKKSCPLEATFKGKEVVESEPAAMDEGNEVGSAHSGHSQSALSISSSDTDFVDDGTLCSDEKNDTQVKDSEQSPVYYVAPDLNPVFHTNLFYDFEKRKLESMAAGQIWAYCPSNSTKYCVARSYVRISKVCHVSPERFVKLLVTWLRPSSNWNESWKQWIDSGFPVVCGAFKQGKKQLLTASLERFSHQVSCIQKRSPFFIHPRKGDIWALYSDWNVSWSCDPAYAPFKYNLVEVLGTTCTGYRVAYLDKVEGSVSLFQRRTPSENAPFVVEDSDLLRFSHQVPSFRELGNEGQGVPAGSFELDPKALPAGLC